MRYWPLVVPVIPVFFALGLMQFLGLPFYVPGVVATGWPTETIGAIRHGSDLIDYGSAVAIHTGVCVFAILYFMLELRRSMTADRAGLSATIGLMVIIVLGLMVGLAQVETPPALYRMSYFFVEEMLRAAGTVSDLNGEFVFGFPRLVLACLFPSAIGIVSVVMASGVVYAILQRVGRSSGEDWGGIFQSNMRLFLRCFYVLSAVLVTSTVTALLFYKIPVGLVSPDGETARFAAALSEMASSAATFWGVIYTLTLLSVFAGPFAVLVLRARFHVDSLEKPRELREWLQEHGVGTTVGNTLKNTLFALAPLLVGPLGDIAKGFG